MRRVAFHITNFGPGESITNPKPGDKPIVYHVVNLDGVSAEDRHHEVAFAEDCVARHEKYGYLTIFSIALSLLFGGRLGFGIDGQEICSGLVGRALERTGEIFKEEPWHMMPADLAQAYQVEPPN